MIPAMVREYVWVGVVLAVSTVVGILICPPVSQMTVGLLYLLALCLLTLRIGRWPLLVLGLGLAAIWEYIFFEPRWAWRLNSLQDIVLVSTYVVVALVMGQLAEQIRRQAKRERSREESERLHRSLLDSVSHELRTPLAVMNAAVDNLEETRAPGSELVASEMRTALRRLNRLVSNLLDQTRVESGALKPRMDWCDASDIVQAVAAQASDAVTGHPLTIEVPQDLPPVRADFGLTEHALANLLLNAARHTPGGTPINVSARLEPDGRKICFMVADRGPGIPESVRRRLFQKFTRGEGSKVGGLGLGLSIARGFISAQGGEIVLHDNPGGGTLFAVYLPHFTPQPDAPE